MGEGTFVPSPVELITELNLQPTQLFTWDC
jgi:hypothetical protein